ncbi:MAG: ribosome-binding factor A [Alphaproteobacteria bacterium]|nr:ribosome-binding factor A [Alphaproteobacteria bacterium]
MVQQPTQRQLRVGEEIRRVLARALSEGRVVVPGLKSSGLMITEVQIAPDLSFAHVYARAIGSDTAEQVALLNAHKGAFRKIIGRSVMLRIVPDIVFNPDLRLEQAAHMADLLNNPVVRADIDKHAKKHH